MPKLNSCFNLYNPSHSGFFARVNLKVFTLYGLKIEYPKISKAQNFGWILWSLLELSMSSFHPISSKRQRTLPTAQTKRPWLWTIKCCYPTWFGRKVEGNPYPQFERRKRRHRKSAFLSRLSGMTILRKTSNNHQISQVIVAASFESWWFTIFGSIEETVHQISQHWILQPNLSTGAGLEA